MTTATIADQLKLRADRDDEVILNATLRLADNVPFSDDEAAELASALHRRDRSLEDLQAEASALVEYRARVGTDHRALSKEQYERAVKLTSEGREHRQRQIECEAEAARARSLSSMHATEQHRTEDLAKRLAHLLEAERPGPRRAVEPGGIETGMLSMGVERAVARPRRRVPSEAAAESAAGDQG